MHYEKSYEKLKTHYSVIVYFFYHFQFTTCRVQNMDIITHTIKFYSYVIIGLLACIGAYTVFKAIPFLEMYDYFCDYSGNRLNPFECSLRVFKHIMTY